ncbi:MAG: hypothetical protein P9M00_05050 [Candidatus Tritonobacter lacicola]|nr:hypothetical protein [Candidatus Tritonobacter lacicola]
MRVIGCFIIFTVLFAGVPAFTDTTRIDYKDPARAAKGLVLLYRDIGLGAVDFFKDIFMSLDDVPKAVMTDIFGVGKKSG